MPRSDRNQAERVALQELQGRGYPNARPTEVLEGSDGYLVKVRTEWDGGRNAEVVVGLDLEVKSWKFKEPEQQGV